MCIGGNRREPERRGRGAAISGPVEGHEPDTLLGHGVLTEGQVEPGAGGAMEVDHHGTIRIPGVADAQYPVSAVYLKLTHPFSVLCNGGRLPGFRWDRAPAP